MPSSGLAERVEEPSDYLTNTLVGEFPLGRAPDCAASRAGIGWFSAIQLRYLQTLVESGTENSTTVVFPLPVDLTTAIENLAERR